MVIVLGIDPGTANTGYGVVMTRGAQMGALDGGVIHESLVGIHARVTELIAEYELDAVAVEDLFFNRNVRSAMAVSETRGVVLLAAAQAGVPCFSYTPQAIKKSVCGSGSAAKDQVQRMVGALLGLPAPPEPDHAADALAVAICHASSAPMRAAVA